MPKWMRVLALAFTCFWCDLMVVVNVNPLREGFRRIPLSRLNFFVLSSLSPINHGSSLWLDASFLGGPGSSTTWIRYWEMVCHKWGPSWLFRRGCLSFFYLPQCFQGLVSASDCNLGGSELSWLTYVVTKNLHIGPVALETRFVVTVEKSSGLDKTGNQPIAGWTWPGASIRMICIDTDHIVVL